MPSLIITMSTIEHKRQLRVPLSLLRLLSVVAKNEDEQVNDFVVKVITGNH